MSWVVGIDENGLGPALGPMISTAVGIDTYDRDYQRALLYRRAKNLNIVDSKRCAGFGQMRFAEGIALALLERLGSRPKHLNQLVEQVSVDSVLSLQQPCPNASHRAQCWKQNPRLPYFEGDLRRSHNLLDSLFGKKIELTFAKSVIQCVGVLNAASSKGVSRFSKNLRAFERLMIKANHRHRQPIDFYCGMVGGIRQYPEHCFHIDAKVLTLHADSRIGKRYAHPLLGNISFEIDADDRHVPVALASILGKYLRELLMQRQVLFFQYHNAELPSCSGYHDPVTRRFVKNSSKTRQALGISDACFVRHKVSVPVA